MNVTLEQFSAKQLKAIELLALGNNTLAYVAKEVDVTVQTIYDWRKKPLFIEAVIQRSRELVRANLPEVYESLMTTAKTGSTQAIKLVLEHLEKLEELKASVAESTISFTWDTE